MGPSRFIKSTINNNNIFENSSSSNNWRPKWTNILPILITILVIAEFAFLGRPKNADVVHSWADTWLHPSSTLDFSNHHHHNHESFLTDPDEVGCEKWLLREDTLFYSRDFDKDPILVSDSPKEWNSCSVGCKYGYGPSMKLDAGFVFPQKPGVNMVRRSMESSAYYFQNNITDARRKGFDVIMTSSLSSDVPVGYFSWAEYDIMAPVQPKNESAAAFISNCAALNFRLQAVEALEKAGIKLHSYGNCRHNRGGGVDKVKTLKRYRFSLAFENSNEEDYVTEKFFQSLVAGTVPVVVGAPNIQDFAPGPGSVLHIKNLRDIDSVAKTMKYLSENPEAFNQSLRWKYVGPSDSFKALVDMAVVHSSCRLCIHLATKIRENEEKKPVFKNRPCKCSRGSKTIYHVYVRERGRFEMESIFLRSSDLTMEALESAVMKKFSYMRHVPIWKTDRPESIRGGDGLKIYRIYPLGLTQRQALYTFRFKGENDFRDYIETHPCPKFEVIFV